VPLKSSVVKTEQTVYAGRVKSRNQGRTMKRLRTFSFIAACLVLAHSAQASETYPKSLVRLVNPFQAGGGVDVAARLIQPGMIQSLGQQVIVDNRPGAGGMIGAGLLARSPADGYTIMISTSGPVINSLQSPITYDVNTAFQPISRVMTAPLFVVVAQDSPLRTIADLIARGKDTSQVTSYSHPGIGTATQFAAALLGSMTGSNFVGVPYRGASGQAQDAISGQVQFTVLSAPDAMSRLGHGLRALAVASKKRTPLAPDVPTIDESGVPGFEFDLWYGLFAPAGTPKPVIEKLHSALVSSLADEKIRLRFLALGMVPDPTTPDEFVAIVQKQTEVDKKLVSVLGLKAN
jgi:tripartite-type tricarboxylate transporter receptor subunit TctC